MIVTERYTVTLLNEHQPLNIVLFDVVVSKLTDSFVSFTISTGIKHYIAACVSFLPASIYAILL